MWYFFFEWDLWVAVVVDVAGVVNITMLIIIQRLITRQRIPIQ